MLLEDPNRDPVEVLAEIYTARVREGSNETIEQFAEEYSDYKQDILELFPTILNLEQLKKPAPSIPAPASAAVSFGENLGDFQIREEIARGGMGVVYRAYQKSLGRVVALKVLSNNLSSNSRQVTRFQKEATAAAKLHHTNIVPVFGVGTDKGHYFYAMQLIDGAGLDVVVGQLRKMQSSDVNSKDRDTSVIAETVQLQENQSFDDSAIISSRNTKPVHVSQPSGVSDSALYQLLGLTGSEFQPSKANHEAKVSPSKRNDHSDANKWRPKAEYWKNVADIGAKVADALGYAHQNGITHRDIKPANILLDEQSNVWVTDFGLAKQQQLDNFTQTGEVLGTFRYMAPEQFEGKQDERSDLHSLGLTLYELCALQPAFSGSSHADLIRQKTTRGVSPLRTKVPGLPSDLETIILKCCSNSPSERYSTADQLAADLRRFVNDEPIHARRASTVYRLGRWMKRNPVLAMTTCSTFLLLILTSIVSGWAFLSTSSALDRERFATKKWRLATKRAEENGKETEQQRREADTARELATKNLYLAMDAFDQIFESIASRGLPQSLSEEFDPVLTTKLTEEDSRLLQQLLGFYQEFSDNNQGDSELKRKNALAFLRMSQIHSRLGRKKEALSSVEEGLQKISPQQNSKNFDAKMIQIYYQLLNQKGIVMERFPDSHFTVIRDAKERYSENKPDELVLFEIAQAYYLLGSNRIREQIESGMISYQPDDRPGGRGGRGKDGFRNRGKDERIGRDGKGRSPDKRGPGRFRGDRGNQGRGRWDKEKELSPRGQGRGFPKMWERFPRFVAPEKFDDFKYQTKGPLFDVEAAIWLYTEILKKNSDSIPVIAAKAQAMQSKFLMERRFGAKKEFETSFHRTIQFLKTNSEKRKSVPELKYRTADVLGMALLKLDDRTNSDQRAKIFSQLKEAEKLGRQLRSEFPVVEEYQILLATILRNQGRVFMSEGNFSEAIDILNLAVEEIGGEEELEKGSIAMTTRAVCMTDLASAILSKTKRKADKSEVRKAMELLESSFQAVEPIKMKPEFKNPLLFGIRKRQEDGYLQLKNFEMADRMYKESKKFKHRGDRKPFGGIRGFFSWGRKDD